jgi:serine/threonine protein kinase
LDFGLAKFLDRANPDAETAALTCSSEENPITADVAMETFRPNTRSGSLMGTLPYMSPEQIQGAKVDKRTDIFSLGIVIYEMATAERPFLGEEMVQLRSAILHDETRPIRELRAELPAGLQAILDGCLAKAVAHRYSSMSDGISSDCSGR